MSQQQNCPCVVCVPGAREPDGSTHGDGVNMFRAALTSLQFMGGGTIAPELRSLVGRFAAPLRRRKRCFCVLKEGEQFCRHCDLGNAGYMECHLMGSILFAKIVKVVGGDVILRSAEAEQASRV